MNSARKAGVEGPDDAHQLKRVSLILDTGPNKGLFQRSRLALVIARRHIPGAGYYALITADPLVFDLYPMAQGAPGAVNQSHPLGLIGDFVGDIYRFSRLELE
jgi:hypothetical protein